MPKFAYAAIDPQGASIEGITKAETIGEARKYLMGQNLYPTKLAEHKGAMQFELTKEKVKKKELMHFTRQLAVFVKAGIPITDALETIGDETDDVALRRTLSSMVEELRNGRTALGRRSQAPPRPSRSTTWASSNQPELTGRLDTTLDSLAGYLEREVETRAKVIGALSYPAVVMVLALVTVAILAGYVLPQFKPLFAELHADLPLPTRMLLFVADLFTVLWYIPFSFVMTLVACVIWLTKTAKGRIVRDKLVLRSRSSVASSSTRSSSASAGSSGR